MSNSRRSWYAISRSAKNEKTAEISIYDEIGGWGISAKQFISELNTLEAENITLRIHSPGGEILDGNAIYNALVRHPANINVSIDGLAASMASVIACAGDTVTMASNGLFMIHNPWTMAAGESEELRKSADLLDKMKENIVGAYQKRTGLGKGELSDMMDAETWMTADEALENGFIDSIGEKVSVQNSFDLSKFKNTAALTRILALMTKTVNLPSEEESQNILQRLAAFFKNAELDSVRALLEAANKTIEDLKAKLSGGDQATEELSTAHATAILAKETELSELKGKLDNATKDFEVKVSTEVVKRCAAAGVPPVKRDPDVNTDQDLEAVRERMANSNDPQEKAALARQARELRTKKRA
jgi:ATP-dependent Clp endopeptidase proteolytic subunit ClpP